MGLAKSVQRPTEELRLSASRRPGERLGARLKWVSGPALGIQVMQVLDDGALARAAAEKGINPERLVAGTIVAVNGVSGNHRALDAQLDCCDLEIVVLVPIEDVPLLDSGEGAGDALPEACCSGSGSAVAPLDNLRDAELGGSHATVVGRTR
eukprot:TRINITY_DN34241_c0_g1_i3.p1 TRINITY_DN34241_c0_g1~~TRINITY_DN34241_c0_g1_i3.p1  ORF type:complete len:152 (-),score=23.06 TRINITY_DN34241_c0_g1_i3:183-638(-)